MVEMVCQEEQERRLAEKVLREYGLMDVKLKSEMIKYIKKEYEDSG
jgi:hypothetical protein